MSYDRTSTLQHVENEIINFLRTDYLGQIRKAIEQRAKIVFIDTTQSSVGFALNKWASDNNTNSFSFEKALSDALALYEAENNVIPAIFSAGAYDYNYRLSSVCLRIPIVKTEHQFVLDDEKLDLISLVN